MHQLDVREQVRLPFLRCVELVMNGVQFRLFRASITVVIVSLAVAFLVTMLSNSLITREVAKDVQAQTSARKQLLFWVNRLSMPLSADDLRQTLLTKDPKRLAELTAWGNIEAIQMDGLGEIARQEPTYLQFFETTERPWLRRLLGSTGEASVFEVLAKPAPMDSFEREIRKSDTLFPASLEDFRKFLVRWKQTIPLRAGIQEGHARALQGARKVLRDRSPIELFAKPENNLSELLAHCGFLISQDEIEQIHGEAVNYRDSQRVEQALQSPALRQRLSTRIQVDPQDIEPKHLFVEARSEDGARWLLKILAQIGQSLNLPAGRVREVADYNLKKMHLADVESKTAQVDTGSRFWSFSQRTLSLLCVSFLVCIVGITNAMLMSVTERFREIATMKCLGATDGFVMSNFLLESCMQGLAGGIIGAGLGAILGLVKALGAYGWIAAANIPFAPILLLCALATTVGVMLSAMAAVYPAWVAARLAPLEAMRVE